MSVTVWTVRTALEWCTSYLAEKDDPNPRLSAQWLLSSATGLSRVELYVHHDRPLTPQERELLREGVRRRGSGEPLQYVTGEVAFRHLVVRVGRGVLIPRPESEILVEELLAEIAGVAEPLVADPCTGSGVIALSLAREHAGSRVWATDISEAAVSLAQENAARLGLEEEVTVIEGDLLEPLPAELQGALDAVVCNPPYIPTADLDRLPKEVSGFEPSLALDGGPDGLAVFRRLCAEAAVWLKPNGVFAVELDESRVRTAAEEALQWYQEVRVVRDLAGRDRIVVARRQERP